MPEVTPEQLEALAAGIGDLTNEVQSLNAAYQGKKAEIDASTADNEQRTTAAIEGVSGAMLLPQNSLDNAYFTEFEEVEGKKIPTGGLTPLSNSRSIVELVSPYAKGFACLPNHSSTRAWKDANLDKLTDNPAEADGVSKFLVSTGALDSGVYGAHPAAIIEGASHPLSDGSNTDRWAHLSNTPKFMHVAKVTSPAYVDGLAESNWVGFQNSPAWFKAKKILFRCFIYVASGSVRFGYQKGYSLDSGDGQLRLDASQFGSSGWRFVEVVFDSQNHYRKTHSGFRSLTMGADHDLDTEFYIAMPYMAPLREGESMQGIGNPPNAGYL